MNEIILKENERIEDLEYKNLKIIQNKELYCFSSDAVLLANLVSATNKDVAVDFGAGSGIISILLAAKTNVKKIYGIEIQEIMAELANKNIILNKLQDKIKIINDDIKNVDKIIGKESVSIVVCNPPYFKASAGDISKKEEIAISRTELKCTLEDIIKSGSKVLKYSGKFYIIHKSERLAEVLTLLSNNNLEPKVLTLIYPKKSKQVDTFVVEAHKFGAKGLKIKELVVYQENGEMTNKAKELYSKI